MHKWRYDKYLENTRSKNIRIPLGTLSFYIYQNKKGKYVGECNWCNDYGQDKTIVYASDFNPRDTFEDAQYQLLGMVENYFDPCYNKEALKYSRSADILEEYRHGCY